MRPPACSTPSFRDQPDNKVRIVKTYISPWPDEHVPAAFPRRIAILGSTGSIGTSALSVIGKHPGMFVVTGLAGGRNVALLAEQAAKWRPKYLAVLNQELAGELAGLLPSGYSPEILTGPEGYMEMGRLEDTDMILSAIVGAAGFMPTLAAARAGKLIALANKEALVLGGPIIRTACHESGAVILPVDSEHNALFQGLTGHDTDDVHRLILTASGGPFRGRDMDFLKKVTPKQALAHPNWDMGAKISIDSATLMNKGLEIIEACRLYGFGMDRIGVVVHPQSIVHSLVEYVDGSQIAHLGEPDMEVPIAHCLCFPKRVELGLKRLDLAARGSLTFEEPDLSCFPCLELARQAFNASDSHPIVLNAANEVAVARFLREEIGFLDIPGTIEAALNAHAPMDVSAPEDVLELDKAVRSKAGEYC